MKLDTRQFDMFDMLEEPAAPAPEPAVEVPFEDPIRAMRDILQRYHDSAVAGDGKMQSDVVARFKRLADHIYATVPVNGRSLADIMHELFAATAAPDSGPILFGQAFKRVVDLGPCRALLEFDGFYIIGTSTSLRAVDEGLFISNTGYRSCSSVSLAGFGDEHVHKLNGLDPLEWMVEAARSTLERDKKTRELIVGPWKPFDVRKVCSA